MNRLKPLAVIALTICAVYLTGILWFNELSGSSFRNTVLTFFSRVQPEIEPDRNYFIKPAKIITSLGGNSHRVIYNDIDASTQKKNSDEAISLALDGGEYIGVIDRTAEELFSAPGYAYNYTVAMPSSVFVNTYPQRRSVLTSRVRSFNWVFVKPYSDSSIGVIFLDTDGRPHEYRIYNVFLEKRISEDMADSAGLEYVYENGGFIPLADGAAYWKVAAANPYMEQGSLLMEHIERRVRVFFGSAGSKWESSGPQGYTYSDEDTVVKYYPAEAQSGLDILEYTYYRVLDRRIVTTVSADYNTAVRFISRDGTIANEYYLAEAEDSESRRVFYFNYAVNNLPLTSPYAGMHPIEVTVENGVVTRYRKLAYNFANTGEASRAAALEAAGSGVLEYAVVSPYDTQLSWRVTRPDGIFIYSAEAENELE